MLTGLLIGVYHMFRQEATFAVALRASEAKTRAIFDSAADAMVTIDERGTVESVNPAAESMFGFGADEIVGRNVSTLMPASDREAHDGYLARYLRTGEKKIIGSTRELIGRRKDGDSFPIELSVSESRLDDRRVFNGIVRDISERQEAQEAQEALAAGAVALRASEAKARAIFDGAADAIITIDERGTVESVNPAAERIFSIPADGQSKATNHE